MSPNKQKKPMADRRQHIRWMCTAGIFAALVFVVTAYLHVPIHNGYVHFGDGFIFLAACLLPMPYAVFVGAMGAALADVLTGYAIWAPGSMLIKALSAVLFTSRGSRILTVRNALALIPAAAISTVGYYLYEAMIVGSLLAPLVSIPGTIVQAVASSIVFVVAAVAVDKMHIKSKM